MQGCDMVCVMVGYFCPSSCPPGFEAKHVRHRQCVRVRAQARVHTWVRAEIIVNGPRARGEWNEFCEASAMSSSMFTYCPSPLFFQHRHPLFKVWSPSITRQFCS